MKAVLCSILGLCALTVVEAAAASEISKASPEAALEYMRMLMPEDATGDCSLTDVSKTTSGGNGAFSVTCAGQSRTIVLWGSEFASFDGEEGREVSPATATLNDPGCYGRMMPRIAALTERLKGEKASCRVNPLVVPYPLNWTGPGLNEVRVDCKAEGFLGRKLDKYNLRVSFGDDGRCRISTLYGFAD
jgi:hypothetical protein